MERTPLPADTEPKPRKTRKSGAQKARELGWIIALVALTWTLGTLGLILGWFH